jgi:SAM-dependent methyltransferase
VTAPGYYEHLQFNAPLSDARADALAAAVAARAPRTVLDIGCGWAELLLRILAAAPDATGTGVDSDERLLARGRARAEQLGVAARAQLVATDGASPQEAADAVVCIGSDHVFGDQRAALESLRKLVRPGGVLLVGTGFWQRPPTPDQAGALGATVDEFGSLGELVDFAVATGYRPLQVQTANEDEWNAFESGYLADWEEAIVAVPPDAAEAAEWRTRADTHRTQWLSGYRGVLGFAYLLLGVPVNEKAR